MTDMSLITAGAARLEPAVPCRAYSQPSSESSFPCGSHIHDKGHHLTIVGSLLSPFPSGSWYRQIGTRTHHKGDEQLGYARLHGQHQKGDEQFGSAGHLVPVWPPVKASREAKEKARGEGRGGD